MKWLDIFAFFSALAAVLSASIVAFHPNILYAAVSLSFCLLSVAGLYAVLGADFVAAAQLIIYVGGVIVVILFAIMMSENIYRTRFIDTARKYVAPTILCGGIFAVLIKLISHANLSLAQNIVRVPMSEALGHALTGIYTLPFEYVALLLLMGLVGAIVVARPNYHEHKNRGLNIPDQPKDLEPDPLEGA